MDGTENDPRALLKRLAKQNSLWIDRVPKHTKAEFKALAFEEFEGDYGMLLKMLLDNYKGTIIPPDSQFRVMLEDLNDRLSAVETKVSQPVQDEKNIRLGDGSRIEKRR